MLPELEQESVHHDIQINRNVFFRFIIFDFVGIKRILILGMKRTIEISLRVKGVCRISIREILIVGMFGQIEFVGEERTNTADLQNTLAAVHRRQLVLRHEFLAELLIIQAVRGFPAARFAGVVGVDGFASQHGGKLLERRRFTSAEEDRAVAISLNCVGLLLINAFELALCLKNQNGGDLPASDGRHQLFKVGNLPDVGALVNQASHMHGQAPAVHVIRLFAEQIEKLGVNHADEEIERAVRIAHDEEQRRLAVAQRVQLQFVIGQNLPKLRNVDGARRAPADTKMLLAVLPAANLYL